MITLDTKSLLVEVSADVTVAELEASLVDAHYTLCLSGEPPEGSVGAWLAAGARGAPCPWDDPADHLVAGFQAKHRGTGEDLDVRAAPRKSVGPDLLALVVGMRERYFVLTRVWLRIFPRDARPVVTPFQAPADGPVSPEESALMARIATELGVT